MDIRSGAMGDVPVGRTHKGLVSFAFIFMLEPH